MSLTRCFFSQHTATLAQFNAQRISQRIPPFEILCDITYVMNQNIRKWGRIVKMHLVDLHTIAFLRSTQNPKKSVKFRTLHRLFSMKNEDVEICCFAPIWLRRSAYYPNLILPLQYNIQSIMQKRNLYFQAHQEPFTNVLLSSACRKPYSILKH